LSRPHDNKFTANGAPIRITGNVGILLVPTAQVFEAIQSSSDDQRRKKEFRQTKTKHLETIPRPDGARLDSVQ
jgi:hypothetical protein